VVYADPPGAGWTRVWNDDFDASRIRCQTRADGLRVHLTPVCRPPEGFRTTRCKRGYWIISMATLSNSMSPTAVSTSGIRSVSQASRMPPARSDRPQSFRYGYAEIKWNLTLLSGEHPSSDGTNWGDSSYHVRRRLGARSPHLVRRRRRPAEADHPSHV